MTAFSQNLVHCSSFLVWARVSVFTMSEPFAGVSIWSKPVPQMASSCLVGQKMLILRNEMLLSVGLITRNEPEGSRCGSVAGAVGADEPRSAFRAWPEDERGSVPGAVVRDERRSVPGAEVTDGRGSESGAVVGDERGSESGAVVGDGRGSGTGESESMA